MAKREDHPQAGEAAGPDTPHHASWPLAERPGFLMRRLHQIHVSLFAEACAAFEITPLQYSVMSALADRGTADQTTLASAVALDRTTTTGIVKRLQARGLLVRAMSAQDRRAQVCSLTPEGHSLLSTMEASVRRAHQDTVAPLDAAEVATLLTLMNRIVGAHRHVSRDPPSPESS